MNTTTARIWMRRWLMCLGLLVYSMILIGGATRLTDSGLSITEWDPIAGALPPFGDAAWASLFDKYKTTAEYRLQNAGMTLGEFKYIFWWEWGHRLFGRLIGLVAVGGFIAFWLRGWLTRPLAIRFGILIALGGLQGFIGWWMVASGIGETSRVDVAPYRLMTHFCLALLIIALITWTWLSLGRGETRDQVAAAPQPASARPVAIGLLVLVAIQLASGALVAGLDAGRSYTDWPLMAGEVFPSNYVEGGLGFRSLFEGRAATQFNHRLFAYLLWGSAILAWLLHRGGPAERSFGVFALLVSGQAIWGILTLVNAAPLSLALLHQGLGVVILLAAVTLVWRANARVADKAPLTVLA
ncbi:MAG: COX15/CtaA family protein [Pseudomonadota bacterium]